MSINVWTAASDGDLAAVRAFLAAGGDANAKDEFGYTPLCDWVLLGRAGCARSALTVGMLWEPSGRRR